MRPLTIAAALVFAAGAPSALAQHQHHGAGHAGHAQHRSAPAAPVRGPAQAEQQRQLEAVRAATARFRDFETARREGWRKFGGDSALMGEHWFHPKAPEQPPGGPLDLSNPSNLQYAVVNGRRELVGVSYIVRLHPGEPLPEGFAGSEDVWHVHDAEAITAAATEERPIIGWFINDWLNKNYRKDGRTRLAMAHAWVWLPNPDGMFRDDHRVLPYLRAGLPAEAARGGSKEAALGVNLASPNGCAETVDGELWVATAKRDQSRRIKAACEAAAQRVRAVVASGAPFPVLNREAEAAWREVDAERRRTLTPRQLERIAIMTEHGPGHH